MLRLPGAPDPWDESSTPSKRDGPPFVMTDMMAAEPALAERLLSRLAQPSSSAAVLAGRLREAASAGSPIRVVGCGTSEHGAMASALILEEALVRSGLPAHIEAVQAFEAALAPQVWRPRDRHLARGRHPGHQRGSPGRPRRGRANRPGHHHRPLARRAPRRCGRRHRRGRSELVPHGRLSVADPGCAGRRRPSDRSTSGRGRRFAPRSPRASTRPRPPKPSRPSSRTRRPS